MSVSTDPRTTLSAAAPSPQTVTSSLMDLRSASSIPCASSNRSSSPTIDIAALFEAGVEVWIAHSFRESEFVFAVSKRQSCKRVFSSMFSRRMSYISVEFRKRNVVFMVSRRVSDNAAGQTDRNPSGMNLRGLSRPEHPDTRRPGPTGTTDSGKDLERQLSEFDLVQLNSGFSSSRYRLLNLRDRRKSRMSLRASQEVSRRVLDNAASLAGRTLSGVNLRDSSQPEHPDARRPDTTDTTDFWKNLERKLSESDLVQLNAGFSSSRYRLPNLRDRRRSRMSLGALQDVCV